MYIPTQTASPGSKVITPPSSPITIFFRNLGQSIETLFSINSPTIENSVPFINSTPSTLAGLNAFSEGNPEQRISLPSLPREILYHITTSSREMQIRMRSTCHRFIQDKQYADLLQSCTWTRIPQAEDFIPYKEQGSKKDNQLTLKTLTLNTKVTTLPPLEHVRKFLFELEELTLDLPELRIEEFETLLSIIQDAQNLKKLHIIYPRLSELSEKFWRIILPITDLSLNVKNLHTLSIPANIRLDQLTHLRIDSVTLQTIPENFWDMIPHVQNLALQSTNLRSLGLPSNTRQPLLAQLETLEITSPMMDRLPSEFWDAFSNITILRLNLINAPLKNISPPVHTPPLLRLTELQLQRDATRNIRSPLTFPTNLCDFAPNLHTLVLMGIYNFDLKSLSTLLSSIPHLSTFKTNNYLSSYDKFSLNLTEKNEEGKIRFELIVIPK